MTALLVDADWMGSADFLAFLDSRPDWERWELIDGQSLMQASATLRHQIIAGQVAALINDALAERGSTWAAIPGAMVDLTPFTPGNMYIPDVLVIDVETVEPGQSTTTVCYCAVEIISPSDARRLGRGKGRKIEVKLDRYRFLPSCEAVLLIEQDAMHVRVFARSGESWSERVFTEPDEEVVIDALGLRCALRDIYRRTPIGPRTG